MMNLGIFIFKENINIHSKNNILIRMTIVYTKQIDL